MYFVLAKQNKMSEKVNDSEVEIVISAVLKSFFSLYFGHFNLFWYYSWCIVHINHIYNFCNLSHFSFFISFFRVARSVTRPIEIFLFEIAENSIRQWLWRDRLRNEVKQDDTKWRKVQSKMMITSAICVSEFKVTFNRIRCVRSRRVACR